MHRHDCFGPRRDRRFELFRIDQVRAIHLDEHGARSDGRNCQRRRNERIGRDDDLVSRPDPQGSQGQLQRPGPRFYAHAIAGADIGRKVFFKERHVGTENEARAFHHLHHPGNDLFRYRAKLRFEIDKRNRRRHRHLNALRRLADERLQQRKHANHPGQLGNLLQECSDLHEEHVARRAIGKNPAVGRKREANVREHVPCAQRNPPGIVTFVQAHERCRARNAAHAIEPRRDLVKRQRSVSSGALMKRNRRKEADSATNSHSPAHQTESTFGGIEIHVKAPGPEARARPSEAVSCPRT